jgi:signal peptidase I
MFPTFDTGHYLIVDKISYRMHVPERYDVVVMIFPKDKSKDFIKRIIGLPGETVNIKNGQVTIVNKDNPKGLLLEESSYVKMSKKDDTLSKTLGPDEYFVMGDNRAGSYDSRYWGALSRKEIIGKPILRLLPIQQIGLMPGAF